MVKYNNNRISQYGNSWDRTLFCLCLGISDKLSYNGIKVYLSSVWGNIGSWSGSGSGSRDGIVRLHGGDEFWRVSPDSQNHQSCQSWNHWSCGLSLAQIQQNRYVRATARLNLIRSSRRS